MFISSWIIPEYNLPTGGVISTKVRNFLIGLIIILLVVAIGSNLFYKNWVKTNTPLSFPQVDGEISLEGLDAPVEIYRDEMGIPHIYASTLHDLFMAQEYVQAEDRFWQMDLKKEPEKFWLFCFL